MWARGGGTTGVVVAPGAAGITVAPQRFVSDRVVIDKVKTPIDGWVVLSADKNGSPGEVIGATRVRAGESSNVEVALTMSPGSGKVFASLYAGNQGSEAGMGGGYGKPLVSASRSVVVSFTITPLNRLVPVGAAEIGTATLLPARASVVVSSALAPAPSWLVVAQPGATPDQPGAVLGVVLLPTGRSIDVTVPIAVPSTSSAGSLATASAGATAASQGSASTVASGYPAGWSDLTVFLFADQGDPLNRVFEFDATKPTTSADQPYLIDGTPVSMPVDNAALYVQPPRRK